MQEGPASLLLGLAIGRHVLAAMHAEGGIYAMSSNVTGLTTIDGFALFFVYFVSGHVFRRHIFAYADRTAARWGVALASLLLWGVLEALSVGAGLPEVPGLTLVFGFAGAGAVIAASVLLAKLDAAPWLGYCGRHSLTIYLSFFAPMAATRLILARTGWVSDVGLMSLIVAGIAIIAPILLDAAVRGTWLAFLYRRPAWARLQPVTS